jgi:hypothetical protein
MEAGVNTARVGRLSPGVRNVVPFALTVACAGFFSFLSGGYILVRSAPVAVVYLLLAAAWIWLLRRKTGSSRLVLAALAAFGLLVAWTGLSVLWSLGPDLSWIAFDLAAFYLVVTAIVALTPAGELQLRVAGLGLLVVFVAVGGYAFLGKAIPNIVVHAHTYARLDSPVGYWNVLALLMVIGLPIALAVAGDGRTAAAWRVLAAAGAVPLAFTFFFTFSRGGWVVLGIALLLYFAFTPTRLASFASLLTVVVPAALVLVRLRHLETLFAATTNDALRTAQGHTLLRYAVVALLVTAAAQATISLVQRAVEWPRWVRLATAVVVLGVLAAGAGGGSWWFVRTHGGFSWLGERASAFVSDSNQGSPNNGAERLVSVSTGRPALWREAVEQWRLEPVLGTGAGTFSFTNYRFREGNGVVKHAHSQWLNVLSGLGLVGLALLIAAVGLLVAAAVRNPFADRDDRVRPLLVAMQAGVVVFVVHMSWDWDWDMAAAGTVFFLLAGTCASYLALRAAARRAAVRDDEGTDELLAAAGPQRWRVPPWALRAAATLALLLLSLSWLLPYLSGRASNAALAAAGDGKYQLALEHVRRAARYDPLAVDPLVIESQVLQQLGDSRTALQVLQKAARLQPDNYEVYYNEGLLLLNAYGRKRAAAAAFQRALALNPHDGASAAELRMTLGP